MCKELISSTNVSQVLEFVQEQEESLLSCENSKYAAMDLMWHVGYYDVPPHKYIIIEQYKRHWVSLYSFQRYTYSSPYIR